jgi:hypothetical protein
MKLLQYVIISKSHEAGCGIYPNNCVRTIQWVYTRERACASARVINCSLIY